MCGTAKLVAERTEGKSVDLTGEEGPLERARRLIRAERRRVLDREDRLRLEAEREAQGLPLRRKDDMGRNAYESGYSHSKGKDEERIRRHLLGERLPDER